MEVRLAQSGVSQCALCRGYHGRVPETEVGYRPRSPRVHQECPDRVAETKAGMGQGS